MEPRPAPLRSAAGTIEHDITPNGTVRNHRPVGFRNGLPPIVPYGWRKRSYPWADRVVAAVEAEHGQPFPVCRECGSPMDYNGGFGRCPSCQPRTPGRQE